MKWFRRIIGLLALAGMLAVPPAVSAADGQLGIYVTPKIIYGVDFMKDVDINVAGPGGGGAAPNLISAMNGTTLLAVPSPPAMISPKGSVSLSARNWNTRPSARRRLK